MRLVFWPTKTLFSPRLSLYLFECALNIETYEGSNQHLMHKRENVRNRRSIKLFACMIYKCNINQT